jgi:hypothetical protein
MGGARRTPLTAEERKERNRKRRDRYAKMTPEQRKKRYKKRKKRRAKMTAEEREEMNRKRRAKMTPEQRKKRNKYERERRAKIRNKAELDELLAFVETQADVDATGPDLLEADIDELLDQENWVPAPDLLEADIDEVLRLMEEDELLKILDE